MSSEMWKATLSNAPRMARSWLKARADVVAVDCFKADLKTFEHGEGMCVLARIQTADADKVKKASGHDAVMTDLVGEGRRAHRVVHFPRDTSLDSALKQSSRIACAIGVIITKGGFAVRVPPEEHKAVSTLLLGSEITEALEGNVYEVSGCPLSWNEQAVEEVLQKLGWKGSVVKPGRVQAGRRTWLVRAKEEPIRQRFQHAEGMCLVKLAEKRPAAEPLSRQRWVGTAKGQRKDSACPLNIFHL